MKMSIPTKLTSTKLNKSGNLKSYYRNFFLLLFIILIISIVVLLTVQFRSFANENSVKYEKVQLQNILNLPEVRITKENALLTPYMPKCTYWDCFNIYKCGRTGHDRITVYVYPPKKYVTENGIRATDIMSKEYYTILESIIESKYYTANPLEACLFVPSIDTLNQHSINLNLTSIALQSLP